MKNTLIQARLRRDEAVSAFLAAETAHYTDIEADVAPLRQQLSAALAQAQELAAQGEASASPTTARPVGVRRQLTLLLQRFSVAMRALATSAKDPRLAALAGRANGLRKLSDQALVEEARRLLSLAPERAAALAQRRFTKEHYQQAQSLLSELRRNLAASGENSPANSLERLLKQNARAVASLRTFFRIYEQDEPELWQRFRAAARTERG
ncbi:hypothetical protein [Hymenobacter sp. CRA2]|uniref:hypothetical protein n=1 Tax=Hymenobacter sp. CRA2 TaxID=1955620 RepID=UPI00098F1253|nr:hypothetical protein [Hymenobacter sp. CRA2]OON68618.1 hypothetical protein B0919_13345 [Hymenobacter sp. CRA2]